MLDNPSIITRSDQSSIFDAYNSITAEAQTRFPSLEGLVLLHDDVTILDTHFEERLRSVLKNEHIGLVGVIGGRNHRAMSWWETTERFGSIDEPTGFRFYTSGTTEVDTVDGLLLVLSPWVARNLVWDSDAYRGFHGYDSDVCAMVRAAGRKVVVADLAVKHHCKPNSQKDWAYRVALYTYLLRWRDGPLLRRLVWHAKRKAIVALLAPNPKKQRT